ncbi:LPXTG cell wall anchor domain-containing protein [Aerococcaceae bacterium DSM 109653]|uniref:LPXTG cell wall anchor domain-containing protein n=2 Tax=Fundicoccus ignavus TaxID=2664442 RepID=A0A844BG14_9LACT|nr:LPXTG cell wall anchor domain-containing protein [Fundicoccus ignavus]
MWGSILFIESSIFLRLNRDVSVFKSGIMEVRKKEVFAMKTIMNRVLAGLLSWLLVGGLVPVHAQATQADTFEPEPVVLLFAELNAVPDAADAIENSADLPASFAWVDETIFETVSDLVEGNVEVTYEDTSTETVAVDVKVVEELTDAIIYEPLGSAEYFLVTAGTLPSLEGRVINSVTFPEGTIIEWGNPADFETPGVDKVTPINIIYPDGSMNTISQIVTVEAAAPEADSYAPRAIDLVTTQLNVVPPAADALMNLDELPADVVVTWQDEAVFSEVKIEINENLVVTYSDGSTDMLPVLVTVEDPDAAPPIADNYQPIAVDLVETTIGVVPEAISAIANAADLPADALYSWQDTAVFDEAKTNVLENVIVTYADSSADMLAVAITVTPAATDADNFTPVAQVITTEVGVVPAAIDALANFDELPDGTEFAWQDESIFEVVAEDVEAVVVVTYPDTSVDYLSVLVTVVEDLTPEPEAELYTPLPVTLVTTEKGVVPDAHEAIANKDELPPDMSFVWEDESVFDTVVASAFTNIIANYADGSQDIVAVPITVTEPAVATHARVIVHFVDTEGNRLLPSQINAREIGSTFQMTRLAIDGYELDSIVGQEKGIVSADESKNTVTYVYRKLATQPQLPNTGESRNMVFYGIGVLALLGGAILVVQAYRKRRQ